MKKNGHTVIECDYRELELRALSMVGASSFRGLDTGRTSRFTIPFYNLDRRGNVVRVEVDYPARKR